MKIVKDDDGSFAKTAKEIRSTMKKLEIDPGSPSKFDGEHPWERPSVEITGGDYGFGNNIYLDEIPSLGEIRRVRVSTDEEKEFNIGSFILWLVLLTVIGLLILGALGALGGIIIAIVISFQTKTKYSARIIFTNSDEMDVAGEKFAIDNLSNMVSRDK